MVTTKMKNHYSIGKQPVVMTSVGTIAVEIVGEDIGIYAVMPNVFDVLYEDYFDVKYQDWKSSLGIA